MRELRNLLQEFYGITTGTGGQATTTYHHVNTGFVKMAEAGGATTENVAYVGDVNSTVSITGYENYFDFDAEYITDDPVCADLRSIAVNQKTGSACERKLICIDLNKPGTTEGTYLARQMDVAIEVAPPSGDPKKVTHVTGKMHQLGDFVTGVFTLSTKTFVADASKQEV